MKARQCLGCAAPLPPGRPGEPVRCTFCGMVHDPDGPAAGLSSARAPAAPPPTRIIGFPLARLSLLVFLLAIVVPVVLMVYSAVTTVRMTDASLGRASTALASLARRSVPGAVTLDGLHDLGAGFHDLSVSAPAGGYANFDAVVQLPWAVTIAQAWAGDARLQRIDVGRVHPDGLVNAQDDGEAEVTYRFVSPDRVEELRRRADLSSKAELPTEFWLRVKNGTPQVIAPGTMAVMLHVHDLDGPPPAHPQALSLAETFKRLAGSPQFSAPFYRGYLIFLKNEGWVWYFSSLSGSSLPRVRAVDARAYPYR